MTQTGVTQTTKAERRAFLFVSPARTTGTAQRAPAVALIVAATLALAACGGAGIMGRGGDGGFAEIVKAQRAQMPDFETMGAKQKLMQDVMNNPDLPAWHAQREKMSLAIGDRTFDKGFERVFDSMTVALATLGSRVNNMERVSGYITASLPALGPDKVEAMQRDGLRQYAVAKGYPASAADKGNGAFDIDIGATSGMMARGMAGLTLSLVRQGGRQTKVKLRFDNVYYPELVAEYYKTVWAAVDKQMFLDQSLD
jgi:hypothetical protein